MLRDLAGRTGCVSTCIALQPWVPSPLAGEGKDEGAILLAPSPLSSPVEGEEGKGLVKDFDSGAAGQTALSGSPFKLRLCGRHRIWK